MAGTYTIGTNIGSYNVTTDEAPGTQNFLNDIASKIRSIASDEDLKTISTAGIIVNSCVIGPAGFVMGRMEAAENKRRYEELQKELKELKKLVIRVGSKL